jgi:murein DD-endopeptidase MepM/ murein hydrolase activator NlpD
MKRIQFLSLTLISFLTLFFTLTSSFTPPSTAQVTPISPEDRATVESVIYQAIDQQETEHLITIIYQTRVMNLTFSPDAQWARAWVVPVDPETGEPAPIEPGLAVVRKDNTTWKVFLQADASWLEAIQASPETLFPPEEKTMWVEMFQQVQIRLPSAPFTGYRLPWKAGDTRSLSQSVLHDKYTPSRSMHYAFDFYQQGERGLLWDIYAAKSGTVYLAVDDVETCYQYHCDNQGRGNYIVLKDTTTTPTSYQLYLHLAQNSIPPALKVIGTPVKRGQFIGIADNTGASYGNHLHFMVHTYPGWWGQSVDITFDDVFINGGRPRVQNQWYDDEPYCLHKDGYNDVCDDFQTNYVSRNVACEIPDETPPNGALTSPDTDGAPVTSTLFLAGWGEDSACGLASGQFITNYDGTWHNIGPSFTSSPFTYEWNSCDVPDGPVEVGLRLTDQAVNSAIVGARSLSKDYTCPSPPVPTCIPGDNEVMLFDGSEYTGACLPFTPGDFTDLGTKEGNVSAIMVGANVQATLYLYNDFTGRGENFFANDNNLTDNQIGSDTAGAIQVNYNYQLPLPPRLLSPSNGIVVPLNDILTLLWDNGGFAVETQVLLISNVSPPFTSTWQSELYTHLDGLAVGDYTWRVRGRNPAGEGDWSLPYTFTIASTSPTPPPTVSVPFTDTMEISPTKWTATGFWHLVKDASLSYSGSHSWWYQDNDGNYANDQPNTGDLTSPAFTISTSGHYYLRFYYRYTTETQGPDWDQRWVQISIDGGPYHQSLQAGQRQQLTDDPFADEMSDPYLSSQVLDLGVLGPGQVVRIRFHFDTLDAYKNAYQGWAIDDVGITTIPPEAPGDINEPNDTTQLATPITAGSQTDCDISPQGDFDYFQFTASAGDRIVVDIDAQSLGSWLDPYLYLLDSDGDSVLAQNDDEIYAQNRDSFIAFYAPHNGTYYLKLRAWNNPRAGGSQYFYNLRLYIDNVDPVMNFLNPANASGYLNNQVVTLAASAVDEQSGSGISRVDFYFHGNDWINQNWELLGSDTDGTNGWSVPFDRPDQNGIALFVKTIDWSRNTAGQGYWNLSVDRTPPQTALIPFTPTQTSTAFLLKWTGSDNLAGIDFYDLQWTIDGGVWQNYPMTITAHTQSTWLIGAPGHSYAFRIRGIDRAGNAEAWPANAETNTTIPANVCTNPDVWEVDNTAISASGIIINQVQVHNFCNPETSDGLYDTDWVTFTVQAGQRYLIQASPTSENTAAAISVCTGNGITLSLCAEMTQTIWGKSAFIDWIGTTNEVLYIRIHHTDGRVAGSSVSYQVYITKNYPVFMPVINQKP